MASRKNVQNTHIGEKLHALHASVIDIVSAMNGPQRDEMLIREAGVSLDRALFPLLVGIGRKGPVGVVELADGVGRDYTTVSRQVAKLERLDLVERRESAADRRVREAVLTAKGRAMTDLIDAARDRILRSMFASWEAEDIDALVRLARRFADALRDAPRAGSAG